MKNAKGNLLWWMRASDINDYRLLCWNSIVEEDRNKNSHIPLGHSTHRLWLNKLPVVQIVHSLN